MLRSSANNIVLRGDGTVETTSVFASENRVPLGGGESSGIPLTWEWVDERWLPMRILNARFFR